MSLVPRRVVHLRHNRLDDLASTIEAVVETDGVHLKSAVTEMGQQPDRPKRREPKPLADKPANRLLERLMSDSPRWSARRNQAKAGGAARPEPVPAEHDFELTQIDVDQEQPEAKCVSDRRHRRWRTVPS